MIEKIMDLRKRTHSSEFRFVLTPEHWKTLYVPESAEERNLVTVVRNEQLKGYAAYYLTNFEQARALEIREICAEDQETLTELINQIIEKGVKENVDFIFVRRCEEPHDEVFVKKGFFSFTKNVIMIVLLNPEELLSALSEQVEKGKILNLLIKGFEPITVKVGKKRIMVVENERPDFTVSTDAKTFLRLLFARTSFLKEFLRRRVTIGSIPNWATVNHFFKIIKQDKWYLPMGDWV